MESVTLEFNLAPGLGISTMIPENTAHVGNGHRKKSVFRVEYRSYEWNNREHDNNSKVKRKGLWE